VNPYLAVLAFLFAGGIILSTTAVTLGAIVGAFG